MFKIAGATSKKYFWGVRLDKGHESGKLILLDCRIDYNPESVGVGKQ